MIPAERREGEARGQRWTIYRRTNSPAVAAWKREDATVAVHGPDAEWVEVVPADEKWVLVEALERFREGMTWAEFEDALMDARAALDSVQGERS